MRCAPDWTVFLAVTFLGPCLSPFAAYSNELPSHCPRGGRQCGGWGPSSRAEALRPLVVEGPVSSPGVSIRCYTTHNLMRLLTALLLTLSPLGVRHGFGGTHTDTQTNASQQGDKTHRGTHFCWATPWHTDQDGFSYISLRLVPHSKTGRLNPNMVRTVITFLAKKMHLNFKRPDQETIQTISSYFILNFKQDDAT